MFTIKEGNVCGVPWRIFFTLKITSKLNMIYTLKQQTNAYTIPFVLLQVPLFIQIWFLTSEDHKKITICLQQRNQVSLTLQQN